jgi:hypothetical protein
MKYANRLILDKTDIGQRRIKAKNLDAGLIGLYPCLTILLYYGPCCQLALFTLSYLVTPRATGQTGFIKYTSVVAGHFFLAVDHSKRIILK